MAPAKAGSLSISKEAEEVLKANPTYERLAQAGVEAYARRLRRLDELTRNSALTEEDAIELGRKTRKAMHARLSKE
ncbi:MAG TPA: hypothetical protein VJ547_09560 [Candidatus Thermoplasmatota archaeon]|nr:hypothetical protein [Candidatus Thermoplasmatota archaeon]